ncbi:MAG: DUF2064 domain-containing protein [Ignavibacteria bacterium]|jgi:glycosyltransferase A (GT-A) superfamily protein (DUF2064 family)
MTDNNALINFVKYPELGNVKTRLASSLGNDFAYQFYNECCKYIFELGEKIQSDLLKCFIFYTGTSDKKLIQNWVGKNFEFVEQSGKNLGEKMFNSFDFVLNSGFYGDVIIGSDIPEILMENI